jgi:hypothetical protein
MSPAADWPADLPAASLIDAGLRSLQMGGRDDAALLICVGASELRRLGVHIPEFEAPEPSAELCLYLSLAQRHGDDAHNQYNSLIQQLVSFERALALERRRSLGATADA